MNKEINTLIDRHIKTVFPGCVVGIDGLSKDDTIIARGMRNDVIPIYPNDVFDIASLTKSILHYGVLQYAPEILDEKIATWLPEMTGKYRDAITVRHLITFGVEYGTPPLSRCASQEEIMNHVFHGDLVCPPGSSYRYTNVSSILLGKVLEKHFDTSIEIFLEKICSVLDMHNTSFTAPHKNWVIPEKGCAVRVQDEATSHLGPNGSAGLVSTCKDMLTFGKAVLSLPYELRYAMTQHVYPKPYDAFGLGFGLWRNDESKIVDGAGNIIPILRKNGFSGSHITIAPFHDTVVVSLANICYPHRPHKSTRDIYASFAYDVLRVALSQY